MRLMPKSDWQWRFNNTHQVLSIMLGDEYEFLTPYKSKLLIPDALNEVEFSVEHASYYIDLVDKLAKSLSFDDAAIVQIALNATAIHFLLKPQMPKSWFFRASDECVYSKVGKIFTVETELSTATVIAVDVGQQATQVMLLSAECELSSTKSMVQFDTIKVMQDGLRPLKINKQVVAA